MKKNTGFTSFFSQQEKVPENRNLKTVLLEVALLLGSALALALSFPGGIFTNGVGFLALIALIPLFAVVRNTTWLACGLYGFLYGFVFYWIFNYWLAAFHPLANILVQVIKGAEMVFLFLALKAADKWLERRLSWIAQGFIWVTYAYLAQSWFAGYPYGTIAYALYRYRVLIQIADFSGIWLITLLIVLPQAFAGSWLCSRLSRTKDSECPSFKAYVSSNKIALVIYGIVVLFQIIYGIICISHWKNVKEDSSLKVATVQHNADSWKGGYSTYSNNLHTLMRLSYQAVEKDPDLIVWSETAFVPSVSWYTQYPYTGNDEGSQFDYLRKIQGLVDEFVEFTDKLSVPLLTGNPTSVLSEGATEPYTEDGDWNRSDYNTVILYNEGEIKGIYNKQHLVPFTEHFPYEKQFPHLYALLLANDYNWWEEGTEPFVFDLSGVKFSTPICFEDIFGDLCADFVKNGADLLINLTNDSWSKSEAAERQHSTMAVFRAVENRKTVLRSTNSGITCLITPDGKIQGEAEPFKVLYRIWDVPVYTTQTNGLTAYTKSGDLFAVVSEIISFALLGAGLALTVYKTVKKKKK